MCVVLFFSYLVLRCTNRHQNKPISSCLCLWDGAFFASCTSMYKQAPKQTYFCCLCLWGGACTRILYFDVQTGTNTSLFNRGLVVYVYGMVLLTATCTSLYKQAPKQPFFSVVYVYEVMLLLTFCTSIYKQAPKQTYL